MSATSASIVVWAAVTRPLGRPPEQERMYVYIYRKTSIEARGAYYFSEAQNAGLIRNWAFLPIELRNYCGPY